MGKFLVIQMARFGDILQSKRLVLSLQARGETHICVDESLLGLAKMVYPGCMVHGLPAHGRPEGQVLGGCAKVLATLQTERFDEVYNLNHAGLNRAVATLFDPDLVRGYAVRQGRAERSAWLELGFRWTERRRMAPLNLVDFWAMLCQNPMAPELVNPEACPGGKGLGVVMAGQNPRRSLEPEDLALTIRAAHERTGNSVFLLGGERERPLARKVISNLGNLGAKVENLVGRTDFTALSEALRGLDLLLSPDTGTAHLAAHLGVPVMGFFCSSAWAFETGPYGKGHVVWQNTMSCAPCLESAPCALGQAPCRKLFSQGPFLQVLSGKAGRKVPEHLHALTSSFDSLGQIWECHEEEAEAPQRQNLRALLTEWLGRGIATHSHGAQELFREKDWMLPRGGRHDHEF